MTKCKYCGKNIEINEICVLFDGKPIDKAEPEEEGK